MKYIRPTQNGWDHAPYWNYLETVRHQMPAHIFYFAANPQHHDLKSENSLHDAWLERWSISEKSQSPLARRRVINIDAVLLGPRHDRHLVLAYRNVRSYEIVRYEPFSVMPAQKRGHGDLLVHELIVLADGTLSHELLFSNGQVFLVAFEEFESAVNLI
jgi:hypothetical protein